MADACSDEENVDDRYVLGLLPINSSYGCCVDRGSNVTIVSPCGFSVVSTGWFAYYLAKMGGFNFVGKSIEVDSDEVDSFYNMSAEPLYDKKKKSEFAPKEKDVLEILDRKTLLRDDFLNDIANSTNNLLVEFAIPVCSFCCFCLFNIAVYQLLMSNK
ncbi:MAG: hypothetical protein J6V00_05075 [Bacteroidaceae bacterium]|nr:hypothetical protein [Bacteroidaceae bacterium]